MHLELTIVLQADGAFQLASTYINQKQQLVFNIIYHSISYSM